MILAIDGYEANANARVGVGRYAVELLTHMQARVTAEQTGFDRVRVYIPDTKKSHMPQASSVWQYRIRSPRTLWTFWALPMALRSDRPKADVVFTPTHYIPRFISLARVMAIMDVSYLMYPDMFRPQDLHKLVRWTAYSARHAKAIITISEFSKNAIIKAYGVPDDRVTVAYPALPESLARKTVMTRTKKRSQKRYILSVGTLQPRKNYVRLIEALSRLKDTDVELRIAGKKGWLYDDILEAPKRFGVADRVSFLNFVPDRELPSLYQDAVCLALPSLYEGFGLPVLEAMVHGTQVVVSNVSSLPEIAGDAGIYVESEDVSSITRGLSQALSEYGTSAAKKRIEAGRKQAKKFDWDKAAATVLEVLEKVASEEGHS